MNFNTKNTKKFNKNSKKIFIIFSSFFLIIILFFIVKFSGIVNILTNLQKLKNFIISVGFWSYTVFALLQFLQVTLLPLPSSVTTITGVVLFGPFTTFIISTLSILLGSFFAYGCGRFFSEKVLNRLIKQKNFKIIKNKKQSKFLFFIMMLFPFFPDDLLCLFAGFAKMDFKFFLLTNIITRPVGLFCLCFISSKVLTFSIKKLTVLIIVFALVSALIYTVINQKANKITKKTTKN